MAEDNANSIDQDMIDQLLNEQNWDDLEQDAGADGEPDFDVSELDDEAFSGTELDDGDFSGDELADGDFSGSELADGDFSGTELDDGEFSGSELDEEDFSGTELDEPDDDQDRETPAETKKPEAQPSGTKNKAVSKAIPGGIKASVAGISARLISVGKKVWIGIGSGLALVIAICFGLVLLMGQGDGAYEEPTPRWFKIEDTLVTAQNDDPGGLDASATEGLTDEQQRRARLAQQLAPSAAETPKTVKALPEPRLFNLQPFLVPTKGVPGVTYLQLTLTLSLTAEAVEPEVESNKMTIRGIVYRVLSQRITDDYQKEALEQAGWAIVRAVNQVLKTGRVVMVSVDSVKSV